MDSSSKSPRQALAEAECEIQKLSESLERCRIALKDREEECARDLEAARMASEELQRFCYAASHDLKEPLRTITCNTQLLERHYGSDSQAAEFISFIIDGVTRMTALIDGLLNYSKTRAPSSRTAVNLQSLVQWALLKLEPSVRESGAQITCGELPVVIVDENQIVQLLHNLLSNALKYRSDDPPAINISSEETAGEHVISVRDNGVGIDPRYRDQLFIPFKRLHGKEVPGVGLGLALCRKIVEGHGGRIWVESDGQHGSVFKFTLPF